MNMGLCVDIDLLWYTYKSYIVFVSTSQTSIYMLMFLSCLFVLKMNILL